ncbi:MAG: hypothetical protein INR73_28720 [Williamsia sp.]|nr:hypothetical protein [Williamsia sp.]
MYIQPIESDYPVSSFTSKLHAQGALLLDYLRTVHHNDLPTLAQTSTPELIHDCYRQFMIFLYDLAPIDVWYDTFYQYCQDLLAWLQRPTFHLDYVVRSAPFVQFSRQLEISR